MAITEGQVTVDDELEQRTEEADSPRDAWLEVAQADAELGALATAARHGRPLPRAPRDRS